MPLFVSCEWVIILYSLILMLVSNNLFYVVRKEGVIESQLKVIIAFSAFGACFCVGIYMEVVGACMFSSILAILSFASGIVILFEWRKLYIGFSLLFYICTIAYLISLFI